MRVTYDKEADAMYFKLTEEKFSKVKVLDKNTILNLDKNGNVIGVEILFVSKQENIKSTLAAGCRDISSRELIFFLDIALS